MNCKTFSSEWRFIAFLQMSVALKRASCGKVTSKKRDCFVHFLHLAAVCWLSAQSDETITLLLVTMPNIHWFKKNKFFTHRLSNKPFLIWLLTTPPHLKYVATLPCNLSLMACFADINVSQGSVARYARCGGIFWYPLNCKFTKESSSESFCKLVKNWQNYGHGPVFWPTL